MRFAGGCLCHALRYEADGPPRFAGLCCCADCRKASGSGFVPYMGYPATARRVTGATRQSRVRAFTGGEAVRNFCPECGSLVFGGVLGEDEVHTVYAGTLDDPALFVPRAAIFTRDRPDWVVLPPGLVEYETMPE